MFKSFYLLFFTLLFLHACNQKEAVDVSAIKVNLYPERYDQLLTAIDSNQVKTQLIALSKAHPYFTEVYTQSLTGWGTVSDTSTMVFNALHHFLTYKDYVNLQKTVMQKYPDTKKQDAELTNLFQHIKYYFPKYTVPKLYYFNSGLNQFSAITYDTLVGVGLDMYLGKDFEFYPSIQLPEYQIAHCAPEYIAPNMANTVYRAIVPFVSDAQTLLGLMIQRGKELYFMDHVLPNTSDAIKIGFTEEQLKWCEKNQAMIWNLFVQQKFLYETNLQKTMPYVLDGPNSQGLPLECPGNVGSYIGWQIVKQYCKKNKINSLAEFCSTASDPQQILQGSAYRPR
jgi:hypothetical protein